MPTDPRGLRGDAPLLDAWLRFQEQGPTPFTIPGHKQRHDLVGDVVAGDVPLYAGLDTMKLTAGVLAEAEARAARLWGADYCRFSTGGSTHANQALALAVAHDGDKVVVSRTLHRSMLLGLVLAGLTPPHALQAGADAMVTSAHKGLPAYSQGALILARTTRLDPARLEAGVEATATTSPAGSILASIDASRALLERDGQTLLGAAIAATAAARERLRHVPGLVVLDGPNIDPLKLTLLLSNTGADGNAVEQDLLSLGMPVESADRDVLIPIVTLADTPEGISRLADAIADSIERHRGVSRALVEPAVYTVDPLTVVPPRHAFFAPTETVSIGEARGRVCAELIAPYPPGIPVIAPGEEITSAAIAALRQARSAGIRIAYAADPSLDTIRVTARPA